MKYLVINGSARKGNTWKLAEMLKNNIAQISPESCFEDIQLIDLELPFCTGCSLCFRKGHQYCPHYSIMKTIIDKVDECDGLIFSVTTFNMQPTALTKNLIDHFCFMLHRPRFFNKKAIVISTVGAIGGKKTVKYLSSTLKGLGFNRCYRLLLSSYSWNDYHLDEKAKRKCKQLARKFHKDVSSSKIYAPSFAVLIPYNLFRGMGIWYAKGTEYETEDGAYWTKPQRAKYVYDSSIPVTLIKRLFGNALFHLGRIAGKFVTVTYKK